MVAMEGRIVAVEGGVRICDEEATHNGSVHTCASCFKLGCRIFNHLSKDCRRSRNLGQPLDD